MPPGTRQCASRAAQIGQRRPCSPAAATPIVRPDSSTCIVEIPVLPQLSMVRREKPSRSTADAETALFETPPRGTIEIMQDRFDGSVRVIAGLCRVDRADRGDRSGDLVNRAAAIRHGHHIATRDAIQSAGRHPARFNRNCGTRHQSGLPFAKHGDGHMRHS